MENPNHLNEPNEAIPEVNPVVPEPNQVVDIHDPNEMVDIPDDIDLVDYDEEDPEEDPEEEPEEDVDIELEDDAELIFPYEVEGDKTPPPGDVSSDSVSSDSESEDEEVDVAPEATVGTITQKPYAIRDFPRGLFEVGESSSARDSSHVDGLAPWALRRDLEASRAQARVMEAELGTCQTEIALLKSKNKIREKERELLNHDLENVERALGNVLERILTEAELSTNQTEIALLKSKNKIGEKERELLNHDLENVERALGNVLERVSVLESGENATLKKRLAETETKLAWARMERDIAERRLHESRVWNKRKILKNSTSDGTEGPSELRGPPIGLVILEVVIALDGDMIMPPKPMSEARMHEPVVLEPMMLEPVVLEAGDAGADGAGAGGAEIAFHGSLSANGIPWTEVRKWMTEEFCPRSVLQRLEQELYNLKLKGTDIDGYTNRFHELALLCPRMVEPEQVKVEQYIHGLSKNIRGDVTSSRPTGEKRKVEGDRGGRGDNRRDYNRRQNQRRANAGAMTDAAPNDNEVCPRCKNKKHAGDCWKCELGSFDVIIGMDWLSRYDAAILCGKKKVRIPLEGSKYIEKGCELFLAQVTEQELKEKRLEDVPVIQDFPEVFPDELPGLPPPRADEFLIIINPCAPVAQRPCRIAPSEMK
ncbi:putative reverse transcriptase domain-containing protein [Tanacetum coccineum]